MYLLRCPEGHEIPVAASAAGGTVTCPVCGKTQAVPTLGNLRRLPQSGAAAEPAPPRTSGFASRIAFAALMFVALAAAASATFAAFRWQSFPVPITVEEHVEQSEAVLSQLTPAQLVDVWKVFEEHTLVDRQPFPYQIIANFRAHWKRICLISAAIAAVSVLLAIATVWLGRGRRSPVDT